MIPTTNPKPRPHELHHPEVGGCGSSHKLSVHMLILSEVIHSQSVPSLGLKTQHQQRHPNQTTVLSNHLDLLCYF